MSLDFSNEPNSFDHSVFENELLGNLISCYTKIERKALPPAK